MKKITLLVLALFICGLSYGQQVLSHSADNTVSDGGSVACTSDPDMTPGSGDEAISDNFYYRAYTPSNFDFSGDFEIMGGQFFLNYTNTGGSGVPGNLTLRFFTSDDVFPAGNLTEIASQAFQADGTVDPNVLTEVLLDSPVIVDASTEIIIAVDAPASDPLPNNVDYRIGNNASGQNAPSYISSTGCSITAPTDFAGIGFPDTHIILDLVGDSALSTDDLVLADQLSLYPNPTNGDMTLNFARSLGTSQVQISNITGQKVMDLTVDGVGATTLNTSRLASGIYFAQIATENASTVIKFVKN